MLTWSMFLITCALIVYTIAVWKQWFDGRLRWWDAILFAVGFACDLSATIVMARQGRAQPVQMGNVLGPIMASTGMLALVLMGLQVVASIVILIRDRRVELEAFPRFSVIVWGIWLIPYAAGALGAIVR